jgi:uncharacterized protein (TIGR00297 family)
MRSAYSRGWLLCTALAAIALLSTPLVSPAHARAATPAILGRLGPAIGINGFAGAAGWVARSVTVAGALVGAAIGTLIYAALGWQGWTLLVAAFVTATLASRLGLDRKRRLGIAEARDGRRGPANAVANTGLAALAAVIAAVTPWREPAVAAFAAAVIAGSSDTVASEIGKAWGGPTWLVVSRARVRPGTPGGISLAGTAAGLLSATGLATVGSVLGLMPTGTIGLIVVAATTGAFLESVLGATFEASGLLDNDLLNLANTACAAVVAVGLIVVSR